MPSTHATDTNMGYAPDITSGSVTCQVSYIDNTAVTTLDDSATALSDTDPHFIHVDCGIGGQLKFTKTFGVSNQGTIELIHDIDADPVVSDIDSTSNMRNNVGTSLTDATLHMEILRDMYESISRPTESAITTSFTDTSLMTFRTTLYQAIKDSINAYITSRVMFAGGSFQPLVYAKYSGGNMSYGDTDTHNSTFSVMDGEQHGRMFLLNVINSCSTSISTHVTDTSNPTESLTDVMGDGYMLLGLTLTTTGGFNNTHTKYVVGLRIV